MNAVHIAIGSVAIAANLVAAAWGGWCWWRIRASAVFWRLLRGAQGTVVLQALVGGILVATGPKPHGLHVLYALLPLLVSLIAEQLRLSSAQMVLDARGFGSAQEVGKLPEEEQRVIAVSIMQRELGVMALSAAIAVVLLGRAAMTA